MLITGRQSGKNGILAALELFALFILGDRLIVHSAHEVATSLNHFEWMMQLIDGSPDLSRKCSRPDLTNGREAIRLMSGGKLKFRARQKNSGRGLSAPRIVFDEAFDIKPQAMGALIPTTRAMPNRQFTYASSAPKADSAVLHSLIHRGRAGNPDDRIFYAEWGNPEGTAMDDEEAWAQANPALGIRVTLEALRDEYRTLVSGGNEELIAEFSREAVGIAEKPAAEAKPPKIPAGMWAKRCMPVFQSIELRDRPGPILAFDVDSNSESASTGVATGSILDPYVQMLDHLEGTQGLPERIVELVRSRNPVAVAYFANGPADAVVGRIMVALKAAELPVDILHPLSSTDYAAACGGLFTDVIEGRLRRPEGQQSLDLAGEKAAERKVGERWAWARADATVPISPLVAVTCARYLLPTESPEEVSPFVFVVGGGLQ